jgi:hypothetical protein
MNECYDNIAWFPGLIPSFVYTHSLTLKRSGIMGVYIVLCACHRRQFFTNVVKLAKIFFIFPGKNYCSLLDQEIT